MLSHADSESELAAFVTVDSPEALGLLEAQGVTINSVTGNIATVLIPAGKVEAAISTSGLRSLSLAHRLTLCNDSARIQARVDAVHTGWDNIPPYTGKGIIIGMIDAGVDFNHINLLDAEGHSRVIAAYLPCDKTGLPPVVDDRTLPGSHYDTPDQIARLTTDDATMSHGTHTTGTAAGSYRGNGLHGIAPDASLVICAMPDSMLTDVNIANSVKYIMDVARRENKPVVINMSLGDEVGPHDGTSMLCRLFDEVSGPGRICVVSAGNSASRRHVIDHTFTSGTDTVYSCLAPYGGHNGWIPGSLSAWSRSEKPHSVHFTAVSKSSGAVLQSWEVPVLGKDDKEYIIDGAHIPGFSKYFSSGSILVANAVEECNRHYHTLAEFNLLPADNDVALGVKLAAGKGEHITAWAGEDMVFTRNGHDYMTQGVKAMSISDLATGDSTISVGAYGSRCYMPLADGTFVRNTRAVAGDIAYFSGYGPDARGVARPDVTASGFLVVSSSNRYDTVSSMATSWAAPPVVIPDGGYTYASQYGTSMSAPVVSGAIALWLEKDPTLGPARVREIIRSTSVNDQYTASSPAMWGAGKLDVKAGIEYLESESSVTDLSLAQVQVTPNPCDGSFVVTGVNQRQCDVMVSDLQGRAVARVAGCGGTVDLRGVLAPGLYVVSVDLAGRNYAAKLIVKQQ